MTFVAKATNILIIFLVLGAFCILPASAHDAGNATEAGTYEPKGVTHMSDAFYDKTTDEYKLLLNLKEKYPDSFSPLPYAYIGITNCLLPDGSVTRCELHDLNDPTNPHPVWADWLELDSNNPVEIFVNAHGEKYALIRPPEDLDVQTWFLPGARAVAPAVVVGAGCLVTELSADTAVYALGVATAAGVVTIASEKFGEIAHHIQVLHTNVRDHIAYLTALRHVTPTENNHDVILEDGDRGVKKIEDDIEKGIVSGRYASIRTYQTKADKDNGCPKQIKYYDKDGKRCYDVDFTHRGRGSHTFPHVHKWAPAPEGSLSKHNTVMKDFRVGIDSTPASVLVDEGVKITAGELTPLLAEVETLTQAVMKAWKNDKCKDYDYTEHRFKHTGL